MHDIKDAGLVGDVLVAAGVKSLTGTGKVRREAVMHRVRRTGRLEDRTSGDHGDMVGQRFRIVEVTARLESGCAFAAEAVEVRIGRRSRRAIHEVLQ